MGADQVTLLGGTDTTTAFESSPAAFYVPDDPWISAPLQPRFVNVSGMYGGSIKWMRPLLDRLEAIVELPDDWDGYGSPAPRVEALIRCLGVLQQFMQADMALPAVAPTTTGGIQFEWHRGGWDIEVEVFPDLVAVAWGKSVSGQEQFYGSIEDVREDLILNLKRISASTGHRSLLS